MDSDCLPLSNSIKFSSLIFYAAEIWLDKAHVLTLLQILFYLFLLLSYSCIVIENKLQVEQIHSVMDKGRQIRTSFQGMKITYIDIIYRYISLPKSSVYQIFSVYHLLNYMLIEDTQLLFQTQEATFCFVKVSNLYVVSATRINANVTLVFAFLHKLVSVAQDYFKVCLSKIVFLFNENMIHECY